MEILEEVLSRVIGETRCEPCEVHERAFSFVGEHGTVHALDAGNGWLRVFHIEASKPLEVARELLRAQREWDEGHGLA